MELKLKDYYASELKSYAILTVLAVVMYVILRFMHWATVETVVDARGTAWEWGIYAVGVIAAVLILILAFILITNPYKSYLEHRQMVRFGVMMTHWEGGLSKAMRDFGKALKDTNSKGIEHAAVILLKEMQVQLGFNSKCIREMEVKLEGVCQGILVDSPEAIAAKIDLSLVVDRVNHLEYIRLKVGDQEFQRFLTQSN